MKMNIILLLSISLAVYSVTNLLKKLLIDGFENNNRAYYFNSAITSAVAAIGLLLAANWPIQKASSFSVLTGLLFGAVSFGQQVTNLKALEYGPLGYTTVIISLSTMVTALSGYFFWNEDISFIQIIGIILMLGCLILSVDFKTNEKKVSRKWFCYCMAAFLCSGSVGLLQKVHQNSSYKDELDIFLIVSFSFMAVAATILMSLCKKTKLDNKPSIFGFFPVILLIISGICVAAVNKLNLYLSGIIDSAVFFPIVNGGGVMLTILVALIIFRERPNLRQWGGILLGVVSIIFLCDPF